LVRVHSCSETGWISGELGEAMSRHEARGERFLIERGAQQMSLEFKVLSDRTDARQECLRTFRIAEAAHPTLAFTHGLMAIFGPIVYPGTRLSADVFGVGQFVDLGLRRRMPTGLVSHDLARHGDRLLAIRSCCAKALR